MEHEHRQRGEPELAAICPGCGAPDRFYCACTEQRATIHWAFTGVIVLSQAFFGKGWTNYELDGLVTRAVTGEQVLLPIWHNVSKQQVIQYSPSLADKLGRSTAMQTVAEIAGEIAAVIEGTA